MKKLIAEGELTITKGTTDIRMSAGNKRMILEVSYPDKRIPLYLLRRAMSYRSFLTYLDMPVYVYVNRSKIVKLNGKKFWIYKPFQLLGWMFRNTFT